MSILSSRLLSWVFLVIVSIPTFFLTTDTIRAVFSPQDYRFRPEEEFMRQSLKNYLLVSISTDVVLYVLIAIGIIGIRGNLACRLLFNLISATLVLYVLYANTIDNTGD
jgi:hypothetical protein